MNERFFEVSPFLEPLADLQRLLDQFPGRGVIIGGIAVSLLGKPRLTVDIDALILMGIEEIPALLDFAKSVDLESRIEDVEAFARENRVILLQHQPTLTNVDISMGVLPFEQELVERSVIYELVGLKLRLPTPEDLIILKTVAHRLIDLFDIQGLIESHPELDRNRVEYWVLQFAEVLDNPDIWDDISDWF